MRARLSLLKKLFSNVLIKHMYHSAYGRSKTPRPSYRSTPNNLFDSLEAIPVTEHQQCEIFHDNFLYMVLEIFCKSRIVLCAKEKNKVDSIIKVKGRCLSKLLSFLLIGFNDCLERNSNLALDHTSNRFQSVLGTLSKEDDDGYETVVKKYSLLLF